MNDPLLDLTAWLLTFLLHSTILLLAAALFDRLAAPRAMALREQAWRAALLAPLLTATLAATGAPGWGARFDLPAGRGSIVSAAPGLPARVPALVSAAAPSRPRPGGIAAQELASAEPAKAPAPPQPAREDATPALRRGFTASLPETWPNALLLLWATGACATLARLAILFRGARRELRGRFPARGELEDELARLARSRRLVPPALAIAPAVGGPVSLLRGGIVLPPWALTALDPRQRRALLAHELAHQARRDPLWILLALVLQALAWPQPLLLLARRRIARLAELGADAWAARAVADPRALAECLTECASRLFTGRAALFGAALAADLRGDSPFLHRISQLLEGDFMHRSPASRSARAALLGALAVAAIVLPGCDISDLRAEMGGSSTNISISGSGDEMRVSVSRPGYRLKLRAEGKVTFLPDESDIATLEPGGEFRLTEKLDGVERVLEVIADGDGAITRTYDEDGGVRPFDDAAKTWLAAALPRMFRESGFDAEARVARLFARGGEELVLSEVELAAGDFAKATYLGYLLGGQQLTASGVDRAIHAIDGIESAFHRRQALEQALEGQQLGADGFVRLLESAGGIDSDFERTELLLKALDRLPDSAAARAAWLAAARGIGSDFERGRALGNALEQKTGDAAFTAEVISAAAEKSSSDFELRQALSKVGGRVKEPEVAAAYVAATTRLESSFERSQALITLIQLADRGELGTEALAGTLESAAAIDGNFEKGSVLQAAAPLVASDPALSSRYREIARGMNEFERGQALAALDDATR